MKHADEKLVFIHMLRGLAVLIVIYCHLGEMFWLDQATCSSLGFFKAQKFMKVPFWVTISARVENAGLNLGMLGVGIFFLISGFLIPASLKKHGCGKFLKGRIARLYPTYAVALFITLLVLWRSAIFADVPYEIWSGTLNIGTYLKNLSLFRDWFWVGSIDAINWTMECDVKFYLICCYIAWVSSLENDKLLITTMGAGTLVNYLSHGILNGLNESVFYLYKFFILSVPVCRIFALCLLVFRFIIIIKEIGTERSFLARRFLLEL